MTKERAYYQKRHQEIPEDDLIVKPGDATNTQVELNYIKWPATKLNFLIYKDGTISCNLMETIKDQCENFCESFLTTKE